LNKAKRIPAVTRRSFLGRLTLAGIVSLIGGWFTPVVQAVQNVKIPLKKTPGMDKAEWKQLRPLSKIKGGVILKFKTTKVLLIRTGKKSVTALSAICTHEQCTLKYNKRWGEIRCPCHGSRYTLNGRVTKPPAEQDLKRYKATVEGDNIILDLDPPKEKPKKVAAEEGAL